ncbi:MAG TPA: HAD family hydrolase [Planctomycetota bacterium]|jgi:phosphoglycolate phosphatase-like HAD superfamily hydrolase
MSQAYEEDFKRRVQTTATHFLPGTSIEIVTDLKAAKVPQFVLFDFDGTLSLVREGWQSIMIPMMVELLQETATKETPQALTDVVTNYVYELTGKQTLYQMVRLAEEIKKRGGTPRDPREYKQMYHDRLMTRIHDRRESLRSGKAQPDSMLVPGSFLLLKELRRRGVRMFLASGTDEPYVLEEARLLQLDPFFGKHIYGALDDPMSFSKQMVIDRILRENKVPGSLLLGFGDGYVEIDNVKNSGGIAVGVATDETLRNGKPDMWKRDRLIGVGADIVVPDFNETPRLLAHIWHED